MQMVINVTDWFSTVDITIIINDHHLQLDS